MSNRQPLAGPERRLLDLLQERVGQECEALIETAKQKAEALLRQAHGKARQRVHVAIESERERGKAQIEAAEVRLRTVRRQKCQENIRILLQEGWDHLRPALAASWEDPDQRLLWCRTLVRKALSTLLPGVWRIVHPSAWDPSELGDMISEIEAVSGQPPIFEPGTGFAAGLRIISEGVCLDGTVEGLLADRPGIEAQLLKELESCLRDRGAPSLLAGTEGGAGHE